MSDVQTPFQLLVDIDQRCRRLAAGLPAQQEAVQSWSGIGFRMGGRFFVAPMGEVGEVLHEPRYTQLPGVKTWVKGVANVRGRLLPIMDLCASSSPNRTQPCAPTAATSSSPSPASRRCCPAIAIACCSTASLPERRDAARCSR